METYLTPYQIDIETIIIFEKEFNTMRGLFLLLEAVAEKGNADIWIAFLPAMAAAVPGIITAIAQIKDKKYKKLTELVEKTNKDNKDGLKKNQELIEEVKKKMERQEEIDDLHREALMTLLRENIDAMYDLHYRKLGWMSEEDKAELDETFTIYAKLGGNHIGQKKYERMCELPESEEEYNLKKAKEARENKDLL